MEASATKMKATALEMEAASEKMKSVLDVEAAPKKMADIFSLTVYVILYIFRFLRIEDRIAFAFSCQRFRRLYVDEGVFGRKLDLSTRVISKTQREVMIMFFRDRHLTENIKELNLSNLRAFNWQMDIHLQKFVKSICPQLEALHILDCGVSLQTLHCILQEAPNLTSLSWSIWDFTSEDIEFLVENMKSPEGICLKNIKHLHLHMNESASQIQIAKYLVLSCCRDLEELKIYPWCAFEAFCAEGSFPLASDQSIPGFHQPSDENELSNLHSLVVEAVGDMDFADYNETYKKKLYDFVDSVLMWKSSSTTWKKFCLLPEIHNSREYLILFCQVHLDDFHSVDAIGADITWSDEALDEFKILFESIGDNTVKRLQLSLPPDSGWIDLCNPIARVGGHSLKFLCLSLVPPVIIRAEQNVFIHTLFSNCLNITELDLLDCHFEKDICESLSELKHLTKVQLRECAIGSKRSIEDKVEISKANLLTFVENCKNITHLHVLGCGRHFSYVLTDDDLLALDKLTNLKDLTLIDISGITEWTFLKNISEHCKFLTTLRISDRKHFNDSHIPILMESSRFLKHLAIDVDVPVFASEVFWNHLRYAKNLERLCIRSRGRRSQNISFVVGTLKSLPRLHVLHLHSEINSVDYFYHQMIRMLEEKESDCRFSFEIVTGYGLNTWINHPSGHSSISDKVLPLNIAELCKMKPILNIRRL